MPDYYNKAFQGGPKVGDKPTTKFKPGFMAGSLVDPLGVGKMAMKLPGASKAAGVVSDFASKGIGKLMLDPLGIGLFGSNKKPSNQQMLMYNYSRVGQLQAKAEAETDPRRKAKFENKLNNTKGQVEKYAHKLDQKYRPGAKFLPPRTFDEIDANRKAYVAKMSGPAAPSRTITRTL